MGAANCGPVHDSSPPPAAMHTRAHPLRAGPTTCKKGEEKRAGPAPSCRLKRKRARGMVGKRVLHSKSQKRAKPGLPPPPARSPLPKWLRSPCAARMAPARAKSLRRPAPRPPLLGSAAHPTPNFTPRELELNPAGVGVHPRGPPAKPDLPRRLPTCRGATCKARRAKLRALLGRCGCKRALGFRGDPPGEESPPRRLPVDRRGWGGLQALPRPRAPRERSPAGRTQGALCLHARQRQPPLSAALPSSLASAPAGKFANTPPARPSKFTPSAGEAERRSGRPPARSSEAGVREGCAGAPRVQAAPPPPPPARAAARHPPRTTGTGLPRVQAHAQRHPRARPPFAKQGPDC